nr:MAG TPA: Cytosine specific methyltransferase [Caudoviricetes sp.]
MKVLSLFDGMSCGQIALRDLGVPIERYYASEIDKHAIAQTQFNFPETIQLGDVEKWREWNIEWEEIDLLLAGSPCQGFSLAGKMLGHDDPRSRLYWVFLDILHHVQRVNPNVKFLLENVRMRPADEARINDSLGIRPVVINSALVSAQNRVRLYWTNGSVCEGVTSVDLPKDRGITICDVVGAGAVGIYQRPRGYLKSRVVSPKCPSITISSWQHNNLVAYADANTIAAQADLCGYPSLLDAGVLLRRLTPTECARLQTIPDWYKWDCSDTQAYKMLGNGWTVEVIKHILTHIIK